MTVAGALAADEAGMLDEPAAAPAAAAPAAPELTVEGAFEALETILYSVASSPPNYRNFAVGYMQRRHVLLSGGARVALPGFLIQCGTSEKFRDFITLYDPAVAARHAFLDQALSRCRALFGRKQASDPFGDLDF